MSHKKVNGSDFVNGRYSAGKKKETKGAENISGQNLGDEKIPAGMKETAQRMMSGQFDMNDMLAQLKQIKKMSNNPFLVVQYFVKSHAFLFRTN